MNRLDGLEEESAPSLYEQVARRISELIEQQTFKPGDRLYSLRALSREMGVSVTTAIEAYGLLEDQGVIEARPQSGYYVRAPIERIDHGRGHENEPCVLSDLTISAMSARLMAQTRDPRLAQFGAAIPNPDLLPIKQLNAAYQEVARTANAATHLYDLPIGHTELRVQISRRLGMAGCVVPPGEIVTTTGCSEAIFIALRVICKPGDTVAVESPAYYGFHHVIQALGLKALEVPTHVTEGIIVEALADAIEEYGVKCVLLQPTFSNPQGFSMSAERRRAVYDLCLENDIPLIEDDIYGDLAYGMDRPHTIKEMDVAGIVLLCSSFSKTLAPASRVGWIAPGRYLSRVIGEKSVIDISSPTFSQAAIAHFLAHGRYDQHIRRVRRLYSKMTNAMVDAIEALFPPGTHATRPAGGMVIWVELPKNVDSIPLASWAQGAGMTIAPGPLFSAKARFRNYIRLNTAFWSERTEPALAALAKEVSRRRLEL